MGNPVHVICANDRGFHDMRLTTPLFSFVAFCCIVLCSNGVFAEQAADCRQKKEPGIIDLNGDWMDNGNNHKVRIIQVDINTPRPSIQARYITPWQCKNPDINGNAVTSTIDFDGTIDRKQNERTIKGTIHFCVVGTSQGKPYSTLGSAPVTLVVSDDSRSLAGTFEATIVAKTGRQPISFTRLGGPDTSAYAQTGTVYSFPPGYKPGEGPTPTINVYKGPSTTSPVIQTVHPNQELRFTSVKEDKNGKPAWYEIDGASRWVRAADVVCAP